MNKGSWLPRYRCLKCGKEWAKGGDRIPCPKCGDIDLKPQCVQYGYDGKVRTFSPLPITKD